jgi:2-polyprenyl-3-methyl-5-hydroxy-6-metoxy-1,4-benzoquinol methylase
MKNKFYGLFDIILPYIKDKEVLDIGCVNHDSKLKDDPLWVHGFLKRHSNVLGVDILQEEVEKLKKDGYNVICGDAETMDLGKRYDVIVAGELIEHLSNQGLFLNNCKKHLTTNGLLILTTPHTFNLRYSIMNLFLLRDNPKVCQEHTCQYSPQTIRELLERNGFDIVKIGYFDLYGRFLGKLKYKMYDLLGNKFKRSLVIIAKQK